MCNAFYCRAFDQLKVKHEPLTLITPQFETPLPALQPAVSRWFFGTLSAHSNIY